MVQQIRREGAREKDDGDKVREKVEGERREECTSTKSCFLRLSNVSHVFYICIDQKIWYHVF